MKLKISLNEMIKMYIQRNLDFNTFDMFYQMAEHELISSALWNTFYDECASLEIDDEGKNIVYPSGEVVYAQDGNGNWAKV